MSSSFRRCISSLLHVPVDSIGAIENLGASLERSTRGVTYNLLVAMMLAMQCRDARLPAGTYRVEEQQQQSTLKSMKDRCAEAKRFK